MFLLLLLLLLFVVVVFFGLFVVFVFCLFVCFGVVVVVVVVLVISMLSDSVTLILSQSAPVGQCYIYSFAICTRTLTNTPDKATCTGQIRSDGGLHRRTADFVFWPNKSERNSSHICIQYDHLCFQQILSHGRYDQKPAASDQFK